MDQGELCMACFGPLEAKLNLGVWCYKFCLLSHMGQGAKLNLGAIKLAVRKIYSS